MTPKEKAKDLLEKINNASISNIEWDRCSEYGKNSLKRKAIIVCDEILSLGCTKDVSSIRIYQYYSEVKIKIQHY